MAVGTEMEEIGPATPDAVRSSGSNPSSRRLLRVALALALLPLLVSAIALVVDVGSHYLPTSDHALTEMQVRDVGHHEVLTGLYSRADWRHPGPMFFYMLAPLYWLTGHSSIAMNLGTLMINAAAIAGMALIARRRGGTPLMLCTLVGCGLLVRTLGAEFVHDPWNNYVTVLPFGLMIFLAWSLTCGDVWALPVAVVVASFLAQTHVGFLVLAVPLLGWGVVWMVVLAGRSTGERRRQLVRWGAVSVALLVVLWLPPLIDVVLHSPSNAQRVLYWFRHPGEAPHTMVQGWRVITSQFGVRPDWLTHHRPAFYLTGEPQALYSAPTPWLLGLLAVAGWVLWRRPIPEGRRLVLTFAVVVGLGILAVARTVGPAFDYRLRWTWVVGMVGFVLVIWAGWLAVSRRWPRAERRSLVRWSVAALVVLGGVNMVSAARAGTPQGPESSILAGLTAPTLKALGRGDGDVLVTEAGNGPWYTRGLVLQLERHGISARVPPDRVFLFGEHRVHRHGRIRARLVVAVDAEITQLAHRPGLRLLSTSIPVRTLESVQRSRAELEAGQRSGRLNAVAYMAGVIRVGDRLPLQGKAGLYAVAVFLDQRPFR